MAEYQVADLRLGISAVPEPTYNGLVPGFTSDAPAPDPADINNYLGMLTTGRGFPMPDKEKMDEANKIGRGREFRRGRQRSGYVLPPTMEIADELNTDMGALLLRRAVGGADVVTVVTPGEVAQHRLVMLDTASASGRQLPSSDVVYALGGADYLYGGVVVDTFRIDQANANVPTFTAGMAGSGLFRRLRDLSSVAAPSGGLNVIARPSVPAPVEGDYMLGAETYLQFTDLDALGAPRTVSLTATEQRLMHFTCTLANNHNTGARRPGDARLDPTTTRKGWYVKRMLHGVRTVTAEMTIMLDDAMAEFDDANNDTDITSFIWRAQGHYIQATDGSFTTSQYTYEIEFPLCHYRGVRGADDNGDAVLTITITPAEDPTIYGLIRARILNKRLTAIT